MGVTDGVKLTLGTLIRPTQTIFVANQRGVCLFLTVYNYWRNYTRGVELKFLPRIVRWARILSIERVLSEPKQ